jgi:four helix bundle protein
MQAGPVFVRSYRDLIAWQKAMDLVTNVYRITNHFPREEVYGLVSQLRRAAVSVPSNIAEGHARASTGEFRQFLGHALGSLVEIETQISIAERLSYVDPEEAGAPFQRTTEIGKILQGLQKSLRK